MKALRWLLAAVFVSGSVWMGPAPTPAVATAPAAPQGPGAVRTITVTTSADEWDDGATGSGTQCSLREALQRTQFPQDGNRGCGSDASVAGYNSFEIKLLGGITYKLTRNEELPHLGSGIEVLIDGRDVLVIDGNGSAGRQNGIFFVRGGKLHLTNITLRNGSHTVGSAVWVNGGGLIANKVTFRDNRATEPSGGGGAVLVDTGFLTVTESTFRDNTAVGFGGALQTSFGYIKETKFFGNSASAGGAVYVQTPTTNPVVFDEVEFKDNRANTQPSLVPDPYDPLIDNYGGGAISNSGNLYLFRTLLENNTTASNKGGGGLDNSGTAVLEQCVIKGNKAQAEDDVPVTWGGGIFNKGTLTLNRCSIYNNEADYGGGIFNWGGGDLYAYNTTIGNNTARQQGGGLLNEHVSFSPIYNGAEATLVHTTIGANQPEGNGGVQLAALAEKTIWLVNSIIDGSCDHTQYTYGGNAMRGPCTTAADVGSGIVPTGDHPNVGADLNLQGLTAGNGFVPLASFMVYPIDDSSAAVDIARNDQHGCSAPQIDRKDANGATRGPSGGLCDAGAFEGGANPPHLNLDPNPALLAFPVVDLTQGQSESFAGLSVNNSGGGALNYELIDLGGSPAITLLLSEPQGTLFQNQTVVLNFGCTVSAAVDHWHKYVLRTNDPARPEVVYQMRCTGRGDGPVASTNAPPGASNFPPGPPGETAQQNVSLTNNGSQPLTGSYGWTVEGPVFDFATALQSVDAAKAAFTLNPGETLSLDLTCTPPAPGVYVNTLLITTSDPSQPELRFDMGCEGQVLAPPEPLNPGAFYSTGSASIVDVAVSPDGHTFLAGSDDDHLLRIYSRNTTTGQLTVYGSYGVPGMSDIYAIAFSHDGHNVYYTSDLGDGVVALNRAGPVLQPSQVITRGTNYICGVNPIQFCPLNTMDGARALAVSPDDQYVYVGGAVDGTLTVFRRNLNTGSLSRFQTITHTVAGQNVLSGTTRIAVSPDNAHVYVTAAVDNAVSVFQRQANGRLSLVAAYNDDMPGLENLTGPEDVAVSPDGAFVYVTALWDDTLHIFRRSPADGSLSLVDTVPGVNALLGLALTQEPEGERLFVGDIFADVIRAYARDPETGGLSMIGSYTHTGSSNIDGPYYLAVSPDSQFLYAALGTGQGIRLFGPGRHVPVVTHMSPASAVVGSEGFTLTVKGGRFYPASQIFWNGAGLTTQFVSEFELRAFISAGSIAAAGPVEVFVRTTPPGGGDSGTLSFEVQPPAEPPIPSIASIEPPEADFGSGFGLTVYIYGANFIPESQVSYNGTPVPTVFINSETLQVSLSASLIDAPGTGGITVSNTPDGGGGQGGGFGGATTSRLVPFRVAGAGSAARPALTALAPNSVLSGSAGLWVTVLGQNFADESVGRWNGQPRQTVVVGPNELALFVTTEDLHAAGNFEITVLTPGALESEPLAFRVRLPGEKPRPAALALVVAPGSPAMLVISGSDFDAGAQIYINGVPRPTTVVDAYEVRTILDSTETGGSVRVVNPGPGGGPSNALAFVLRRVWLPIVGR